MPKSSQSNCRTKKHSKPTRKAHVSAPREGDLKISYRELLLELDRRVATGWQPDDQAYFSDLVFNLLVNQYAAERLARGQAERR